MGSKQKIDGEKQIRSGIEESRAPALMARIQQFEATYSGIRPSFAAATNRSRPANRARTLHPISGK